jgi:hypothetical protein
VVRWSSARAYASRRRSALSFIGSCVVGPGRYPQLATRQRHGRQPRPAAPLAHNQAPEKVRAEPRARRTPVRRREGGGGFEKSYVANQRVMALARTAMPLGRMLQPTMVRILIRHRPRWSRRRSLTQRLRHVRAGILTMRQTPRHWDRWRAQRPVQSNRCDTIVQSTWYARGCIRRLHRQVVAIAEARSFAGWNSRGQERRRRHLWMYRP